MKKLALGVLLAIFAFAIYSCSTNDENETVDIKNVKDSTEFSKKELVNPYNKNNKWDSSGIKHNFILSKVVLNKAKLGKNTDAYIEYSNAIFHEYFDKSYTHTCMKISETREVLADSTNLYANVIKNSNLTTATKEKIHDLFGILKNSLSEQNLTYKDVKDKIVNFENDILFSNLKDSEKDEVLKISSVARHSLYFWNHQLGGSKNSSVSSKRRWWKWLVVGIADAAGATSGALVGSPTGIGAVAGGIAGAAGASAGAASLLDWISPDK